MTMNFRRSGRSGVLLPEISLGLWHNFGAHDDQQACYEMIARCMDLGICHFDLANNYGPPPGSAEESFGRLMQQHFMPRRDEMFIATKAGHLMWEGVYGDWGSRKHLLASLDQSLTRMGLDYVDVFYSHRPDPETPIEETVGALVTAVRSGKALYAGLSKYPPALFHRACELLREEKVPCLLHQFRYNMLHRECEEGMLPALKQQQTGSIVFSPLAQGQLTGKYLASQLPTASRAARADSVFLNTDHVQQNLAHITALNELAQQAGIPLTQLAIRWLLARDEVTSVLIGARNVAQLEGCASAIGQPRLEESLIQAIAGVASQFSSN